LHSPQNPRNGHPDRKAPALLTGARVYVRTVVGVIALNALSSGPLRPTCARGMAPTRFAHALAPNMVFLDRYVASVPPKYPFRRAISSGNDMLHVFARFSGAVYFAEMPAFQSNVSDCLSTTDIFAGAQSPKFVRDPRKAAHGRADARHQLPRHSPIGARSPLLLSLPTPLVCACANPAARLAIQPPVSPSTHVNLPRAKGQ